MVLLHYVMTRFQLIVPIASPKPMNFKVIIEWYKKDATHLWEAFIWRNARPKCIVARLSSVPRLCTPYLKYLNCLWCLNYFCGILLVRWREAWRWPPGGRECLKFQALASEWNLPLPLKFVKPTLRPLFTNKSVLEQSSVCEALGIESAVPTFMNRIFLKS